MFPCLCSCIKQMRIKCSLYAYESSFSVSLSADFTYLSDTAICEQDPGELVASAFLG